MPLYEYRCETCSEKEEKLESFSAPTEHACPKCGAEAGMRRQISVTAFTLAGGGWMAQGYGSTPGKSESTTSSTSIAAPSAKAASPAATPPASGGCSGGCGCHPAKP